MLFAARPNSNATRKEKGVEHDPCPHEGQWMFMDWSYMIVQAEKRAIVDRWQFDLFDFLQV
jgi:hypothetical protein